MGDDDVDVIMMRTMGMRVWMMGERGEMRGGTFSYVETGKHENVVVELLDWMRYADRLALCRRSSVFLWNIISK